MSDVLFKSEPLTNTNLLAVLRRSIPTTPASHWRDHSFRSESAVSVAFDSTQRDRKEKELETDSEVQSPGNLLRKGRKRRREGGREGGRGKRKERESEPMWRSEDNCKGQFPGSTT